ncbi:MAG: hypothetical protein ACRECO_08310, partial [Xanthobacteraceae bacterium]
MPRLFPFHPSSPIVRLSVPPDHDDLGHNDPGQTDPGAVVAWHGRRQVRTDAKVAAVRRLKEAWVDEHARW